MTNHFKARLDWIEAARGIAAIVVVLYHAARKVHQDVGDGFWLVFFQFGHAGVDLFFVISGFIILHAHYGDVGRPKRLMNYLNRRLTRIYPTYWVGLLVTVAMGAVGSQGLPSVWAFFRSAMLLPSQHEPLLGVAWTLTFEIVFYGVFAFLIVSRKLGLWLLAGWMFCLALVASSLLPTFGLPSSLFALYNVEFFLGMLVAYALRHWRLPSAQSLLLFGGALFAGLALAENLKVVNGYADWMRITYGPASALLVAGCAVAGQSSRAVPQWLRTAGGASYSIYLFQFVFIGIVWKVWKFVAWSGDAAPHVEFFLLSLAGILGGVWISRLVEYPLMKWVRRKISRND